MPAWGGTPHNSKINNNNNNSSSSSSSGVGSTEQNTDKRKCSGGGVWVASSSQLSRTVPSAVAFVCSFPLFHPPLLPSTLHPLPLFPSRRQEAVRGNARQAAERGRCPAAVRDLRPDRGVHCPARAWWGQQGSEPTHLPLSFFSFFFSPCLSLHPLSVCTRPFCLSDIYISADALIDIVCDPLCSSKMTQPLCQPFCFSPHHHLCVSHFFHTSLSLRSGTSFYPLPLCFSLPSVFPFPFLFTLYLSLSFPFQTFFLSLFITLPNWACP